MFLDVTAGSKWAKQIAPAQPKGRSREGFLEGLLQVKGEGGLLIPGMKH
jgi:hypothetical protein